MQQLKTVVIHQPDFLPYLGFFDRLLKSNLFVVFDDVQYVDRGWINRDKIKTPSGKKWITIGVQKASRDTKINDIKLAATDWKDRHLSMIYENYRKAAYYDEVIPYVQALYDFECEMLIDFTMKSIVMLLELFDIKIDIVYASSLQATGKSNERLVSVLNKVQAAKYLSGIGARAYYQPMPFESAGIQVVWQEFHHPVYPQLYGEFIPYLSSMDLFFNCGIRQSREIIRSC
ncbi:MAG: WbqC-like family protein [Clostridia bacterium]|jgi:hypothetical protein|nr:WbqC-like family protein [Clostridia bacterium]